MNIEELRKFCLSLPNVTEDIKWGHDLCFLINEKMFCVTGADSKPMMVSLKVKDDEFDDLCATPNIISAPYVGRFKWILIQNVDRFSRKEWERYITQSYELIKSKASPKKKRPSGIKNEKINLPAGRQGIKSKGASKGVKKVVKKKTKPSAVKSVKRKVKSVSGKKKMKGKKIVKRKVEKKVKAKKRRRK
ncbi:MAG: MmcQ/YjbR family DNA-binding protein [Flavobacteriales bacterium]